MLPGDGGDDDDDDDEEDSWYYTCLHFHDGSKRKPREASRLLPFAPCFTEAATQERPSWRLEPDCFQEARDGTI